MMMHRSNHWKATKKAPLKNILPQLMPLLMRIRRKEKTSRLLSQGSKTHFLHQEMPLTGRPRRQLKKGLNQKRVHFLALLHPLLGRLSQTTKFHHRKSLQPMLQRSQKLRQCRRRLRFPALLEMSQPRRVKRYPKYSQRNQLQNLWLLKLNLSTPRMKS